MNSIKHASLLSIFMLISVFYGISQDTTSTNGFHQFHFNYAYNFPGAEMSERFKNHNEIGFGFDYNFGRWYWSTTAQFMFGPEPHDSDLFYRIDSGNGTGIISREGQFAEIRLYQRGIVFMTGLHYVFWQNEYLEVKAGLMAGHLSHRTRIEVIDNSVPQLSPEYRRGYDRLAGGLAIRPQILIQYSGDNNLANFFMGLEFTQGYLESMRSYNYTTFSEYQESRNDNYFGIRLGWVIPIGSKITNRYYTY